jgi:uncharacterized glyoxalase superfamily protein PhnB
VTLRGHATVLLVSDVGRSTDHYRDKLGFEVSLYERIPEHYGFAERDACHVHFACFEGAPRRPPNCELVPPDMFDVYVYPDGVDELYAELVGRGADVVHPPVEQGYGLYEFRVRDPDGYVLAFGRVI